MRAVAARPGGEDFPRIHELLVAAWATERGVAVTGPHAGGKADSQHDWIGPYLYQHAEDDDERNQHHDAFPAASPSLPIALGFDQIRHLSFRLSDIMMGPP